MVAHASCDTGPSVRKRAYGPAYMNSCIQKWSMPRMGLGAKRIYGLGFVQKFVSAADSVRALGLVTHACNG
eukprot:6491522-Amphidinium_carterae.1